MNEKDKRISILSRIAIGFVLMFLDGGFSFSEWISDCLHSNPVSFILFWTMVILGIVSLYYKKELMSILTTLVFACWLIWFILYHYLL